MSLTRANCETILVKRLGALLSEASLAVTIVGSNADLNDPIGWAVRQCGGSVASVTSVADADVATVAASDMDKLLDLAELRTLETISGNLAGTDIKVGPRSENLDLLAQRVEQRLARKQTQLQRDYGFGLGTLEAGVIRLGFMQTTE